MAYRGMSVCVRTMKDWGSEVHQRITEWSLRCQWKDIKHHQTNDMKESVHEWLNEWTHQWTDKQTHEWGNRQIKESKNEAMNESTIEQVNQWVTETKGGPKKKVPSIIQWLNEPLTESTTEWSNHMREQTNEQIRTEGMRKEQGTQQIKPWVNERTNERINE